MVALMVAWIGVLGLAGCKQSNGELSLRAIGGDSAVSDSRLSARPVIDAGIQFIGRPNFLCLPIEKLGLGASDEVLAARSSCGCVIPQIVFYQSSQSEIGSAVLLDFDFSKGEFVDSINTDDRGTPVQLAVVVSLVLADSRTREFVVNLVFADELIESFISKIGRPEDSHMLVRRCLVSRCF
jgi:hypothetical protein